MVQLGFFMHMKLAMGAASLQPTRPLLFATAFMLVFSIVIALFKDIPDVKGDRQVGVPESVSEAHRRYMHCALLPCATACCIGTIPY